MAEKNNATCRICGKPYYMCLSCSDAMRLNPWKIYTDSSNCYQIFQVVRGFSTGVYTKDEAREKLQNVDLKDVDSFKSHIKKIVKDILKKPVVEDVEKTITEKVIGKTEDALIKEETVVVEKPVFSRKRNFKVETE